MYYLNRPEFLQNANIFFSSLYLRNQQLLSPRHHNLQTTYIQKYVTEFFLKQLAYKPLTEVAFNHWYGFSKNSRSTEFADLWGFLPAYFLSRYKTKAFTYSHTFCGSYPAVVLLVVFSLNVCKVEHIVETIIHASCLTKVISFPIVYVYSLFVPQNCLPERANTLWSSHSWGRENMDLHAFTNENKLWLTYFDELFVIIVANHISHGQNQALHSSTPRDLYLDRTLYRL